MSQSENNENKDIILEESPEAEDAIERNTEYSIGDDRRVKSLTPGALVRRRFFRNKVAVIGLWILIFMFVFSFIGGLISPYKQDQMFYRQEKVSKDFAYAKKSDDFQFMSRDSKVFTSAQQADMIVAIFDSTPTFDSMGSTYSLKQEGTDFYGAYSGNDLVCIAFKSGLTDLEGKATFDFDTTVAALRAYTNGETSFDVGGTHYTIADDMVAVSGQDVGTISSFILRPAENGVTITADLRNQILQAIEDNAETVTVDAATAAAQDAADEAAETETATDGAVDAEAPEQAADSKTVYTISYDPAKQTWTIQQEKETTRYDTYSSPSLKHPLGTDVNGMDMMTRLMYGGRVSLLIGFIVEFIAGAIGITLGGISGYFGGWVDNLIMRIVDIFYCIPSMPLIIILGAVMDALRVSPTMRMVYLMMILGFLGWPGMARLVRGQVLLFREQEFMIATEATGLSARRRIFKHLVPNVIPQLIVSMTMGLGDTIITEATLSFLGLGVKFPFASWGNIISDVNNTYVLTNYWFIWIPAGVLLLLTVLAFNLVGDGLRDAFDPRMKR